MGIHGVGGVHSNARVKGVTTVDAVEQTDVGSAPASVENTEGSKRDTFRSDFSSLVRAVQDGDLSAAQSAVTALQSDVPPTSATYSPASTSQTSPAPTASAAQSDLSALFQAVKSGDVAGAEAALKQLQGDVRSSGDHASLQGQIHGRGHWSGNGHHASGLWTAVSNAFQLLTSAPTQTTPSTEPVTDTTTEPVSDPVVDPAPATDAPVVLTPETTEPVAVA